MSGVAMILAAGGGQTSAGVVLSDAYPVSIGGGTRTATYRINTDGYIYHGDNGVYTAQYLWKQNANASSAYEARVDVSLGGVSGTTGTWLGLGTTRDWSQTDSTANGDGTLAGITVQIRDASTLAILASAYIELSADRYS